MPSRPFHDKALPWMTGRSFHRGTQILKFAMPDSPAEKYRPMYNLQQQHIEQYLWEAITTALAAPSREIVPLIWSVSAHERHDAGTASSSRAHSGRSTAGRTTPVQSPKPIR